MIEIKDPKDCCGCWACENACPRQCISMEEDCEGFRYPHINQTSCIDCHLCEKVCPILNKVEEPIKNQKAFVVQNKDEEVLKESTSGGAFSAIANYVISKNGIVFGAAFDNNETVRHQYVDNYEDLRLFRNSKYVQSLIGNTYKEAKRFLDEGKLVLFSGTPCQLEGLFFFLRNKQYENLITIDVVCRAVPSPLVLRKYLEMQKEKMGTEFTTIKFRDKHHGYKYSSLSLWGKNNKEYHEGIDTDPYLRAFFSSTSMRPSCTQCKFRSRYRKTDITMWDCFDVENYAKKLDNDKGATRLLIHTKKGIEILNNIKDNLLEIEIDTEKAIKGVKEMVDSVKMNPNRNDFFKDINCMDPKECFNKYYPNTIRHRIEKQARLWSNRLGLYKIAKKTVKALIGNKEIKR